VHAKEAMTYGGSTDFKLKVYLRRLFVTVVANDSKRAVKHFYTVKTTWLKTEPKRMVESVVFSKNCN